MGFFQGHVMSLNEQIRNFEEVTLPELRRQLGLGLGCSRGSDSSPSLGNYLFVVGTGGNDYSFNYFLANRNNVSLQSFTANLTSSLSTQLKVHVRNLIPLFSTSSFFCILMIDWSMDETPYLCNNIYTSSTHCWSKFQIEPTMHWWSTKLIKW